LPAVAGKNLSNSCIPNCPTVTPADKNVSGVSTKFWKINQLSFRALISMGPR